MNEFEIVAPDDEIYAEISRRFVTYNQQFTNWGSTVYSVVRRNGERITAAARGATNMGLVEVRGVWIDEDLRGQGVGTALMRALEEEARQRGCSRAVLDTYSWQAQGFYAKLGYREFGVLDYPNGTQRHFLVKDL